jgi:Beta-propeller repeat.
MTASANFPTYLPMQASLGGGNDAFVVKLNPAGSAFVYSTFLGGSGIDYGESIAIDSSLNAYVAGYTSSVDFPAVNADQPVNGGAYDAFIAKLNVSGSALTDTDLLGGSGSDAAYGIALDSSASAYLAGQTGSSNFPLKTPAQSSLGTTTLAAFVAKFTFGATGPPTAVSVTPPGSSGASQTFTLVYSDARGFADINWVEMNWNATLSTANACYVHYDRSINTIRLSTDAGSGWIGSGVLGSAGILQNSQCLLDVGASSFSGAGGSLTVNLALTFKAGFAGAKNIYMQVQDNANTLTAWQARGTWTVVAAGPANVSVAPASGSGANQTFSFVYSDPYGNADINWAQMHFQTQLVSQNACYLQYTRASNVIQLVNDSGGGYAGSAAVGIAGSLNNSQCTLDTGASSVAVSGNNLTLNLALIFKPAFAGAKNISMGVVNNANVFSGWQVKGTWTVAAGGSLPAANVSVTPASGAGSSQTFSFVYSDAYAYTDINWVQMHLQTQLVADHACYLQYTRASNSIQLINDAGTGYVGTGSTVGSIGTLANGQCTLDTGASSVSGAGNNLTVTLALSFTASFQGPKTISMGAVTNSYVFSGWQAKGSWTATQAGNLPPVNNSVTPSSGAGSNQMFGFAYSDPYGFTDIALAQMHFQTQLVGNNACYLQYTRATNTIQLFNDAGTGFVGSGGVLGGAGTLANSQCTLNLGSSSSSGAGNNLTVNLALTFMPLFNGAKTASMNASNNATISAGWQAKGTWTVQ